MDAYLLHKILSQLEFYQVWKWRELSKWCKKEIEDTHNRYIEKLTLEVCSEEDDFVLFPKEKLVFRCVWYDREKNIFRFELDNRSISYANNQQHNNIKSNTPLRPDSSNDINGNRNNNNYTPPMFLKFWEKYYHCSISFSVNSKPTRSYYTVAIQHSPSRKANRNTWYKTDTVYYGLRTRLADYDFFLDFYRSMDIYKELVAYGFLRTKSTQSKLALMQEDVQRIIKELQLYEQPIDEVPIYMHASPSFLFPHLSNRVCVFPDRLQALEEAENNDVYDTSDMAVVKWLASQATQIPKVFNTQNQNQAHAALVK